MVAERSFLPTFSLSADAILETSNIFLGILKKNPPTNTLTLRIPEFPEETIRASICQLLGWQRLEIG